MPAFLKKKSVWASLATVLTALGFTLQPDLLNALWALLQVLGAGE